VREHRAPGLRGHRQNRQLPGGAVGRGSSSPSVERSCTRLSLPGTAQAVELCAVCWKGRGSQNQSGGGWKGPLWVTQPNPLPKQGHPEPAAQHRVQAGLEYLQRRRISPEEEGDILRGPHQKMELRNALLRAALASSSAPAALPLPVRPLVLLRWDAGFPSLLGSRQWALQGAARDPRYAAAASF